MDIELSTILKSRRMLVHILSILAILAMAFPATGNVNALIESAPPEGGHDGSEGVGHANTCNAFGWAQDPDDTTREVEVRILDNGNEIASGMTGDHGFYFNLWGLFPTYEEHQITAQAQDEETGTWVDLADTPRLLNCVNYDIYLLNTKNGNVERLTTLENTGEYNPSWSPDGKRIVHDVTDANFHALYITDVKTRMSQPLPGADGGNDADWSPDGIRILFDRGPYGDPSLYLLPPTGGTPTLLVENAVSGDWSPDSQRVVFEREGSIWTANIAGGDETLITEAGHNPVWSKDGLWLAYDLDGDLWKVGVDLNGSRTGEPVQLTSGPVTEGGATWSNNGKSLAFSSDASGDFDVWKISSSGGAPIQLRGAQGFGEFDPAFSSNGQYIAYDGALEPSVPHLEVDARLNSYALVDWPAGQPIAIHMDDPATGRTPDYRTTFTPDGSTNYFSFQPDLDLRPGFVIRARSMYFEKVLVISELAATSVDAENGIVSGVATSNHAFFMVADGDHFRLPIGLDVTTDENGNWSADFSSYDTPLPWEWFTGGEMFEWDEDGDLTHARWHVHQEVVEVWLAQNEIRAFDWLVDTELHFAVYDPNTDQTFDYFAGTEPQDWFDGTAAVVNAGDLQLMPGMTVTVTDGITGKSTVVQDIKITTIDVNDDLVYGYAPPNASLDLGSFEDSPFSRFFSADGNGDWSIDYREPSLNGVTVDLNPGDNLQLFMREEDRDSTVWETFAPNTRFTVFPEWNNLEGYEWPDGALVSISVADKDVCSTQAVAGFPEWDPSNTFFSVNFPEGCAIGAGDFITLSSESLSLTHQVQEMAITEVDIDFDKVTGTAIFYPEQYLLHTWIHGVDGSYMQLSVEEGAWLADFGAQGFDLQPGMGGRVELVDQASNATAVEWYISNPHLTVFPEWEWFDGYDWPDGAAVTITVEGKPECTTEGVSSGNFFNGGFPEGCDVAVGDIVTFTDGATVRTHTVHNLTVTAVDREANIVAGTADVGEVVYVWPHATGQQLQATVDSSDTWQVDFTDVFDLVEGTDGRSEIRDEQGNSTAVDWRIPNPHFSAFPEWESIEGWEWPLAAMIHLAIDDPTTGANPDFEQDQPVVITPWDANGRWVQFNFNGQYDLKVGDVVTLSDGVTPRTHTVRNLSITGVDEDTNIVSGTADASEIVYVWPHATGQQVESIVGSGGTWDADFTGIFDLVPGEAGRSEVRDEFGNATAVDWYIPNPRFVVFPDGEWFDGLDWPDGITIAISVKGKPECATEGISIGYFFNGGFPDGCDVAVGDEVTFTDGQTVRTHLVRSLAVIAVDKMEDTVTGTADAFAEIFVWPHATGEQLSVTADENGNWQADFTGMFDLAPNECGRSEIRDEAGNSTAVDWCVPPPAHFVVQITDDWFRAENFAPNTPVNFWIYDAGGSLLLESTTPETDTGGTVSHWVGDQVDLLPGYQVIVSDGVTTKDIRLEALAFDVFDTSLGTLQGTAPEPFDRTVWVGIGWDNDGWSMEVTTSETGTWIADFGMPVPADYDWVAAQIFDPDGDASEVRPALIVD